jgi:hypothetical protein
MDDTMRPSRAAKRRSVHGEQILFSNVDDTDATSSHADTDSEQPDHSEGEDRDKTVTKTKKSSTGKLQAQLPSRRSARKTSHPEAAYRTDIHPQDRNIQEASEADEVSPNPNRKRTRLFSNPAQATAAPAEELSDEHPDSPPPGSVTDVEDEEMAGNRVSDGESERTPQNSADW